MGSYPTSRSPNHGASLAMSKAMTMKARIKLFHMYAGWETQSTKAESNNQTPINAINAFNKPFLALAKVRSTKAAPTTMLFDNPAAS